MQDFVVSTENLSLILKCASFIIGYNFFSNIFISSLCQITFFIMLNNVQDDAVATLHLVSITRVHAYTHITYHTHTHTRTRMHAHTLFY